jgi:hypothetical protein
MRPEPFWRGTPDASPPCASCVRAWIYMSACVHVHFVFVLVSKCARYVSGLVRLCVSVRICASVRVLCASRITPVGMLQSRQQPLSACTCACNEEEGGGALWPTSGSERMPDCDGGSESDSESESSAEEAFDQSSGL